MPENNLPPHLQYLSHLDPSVLKALDGTSHHASLERQDLIEYHPYSVLLSDYNIEAATAVVHEGVTPRLFGYRINKADVIRDKDIVRKTARRVLAQVDSHLLLPYLPNPQYRDGGIPPEYSLGNLPKVVKAVVWIPLEIVPLPSSLSSELCIRIVVNSVVI